jgi:hypothetical protein
MHARAAADPARGRGAPARRDFPRGQGRIELAISAEWQHGIIWDFRRSGGLNRLAAGVDASVWGRIAQRAGSVIRRDSSIHRLSTLDAMDGLGILGILACSWPNARCFPASPCTPVCHHNQTPRRTPSTPRRWVKAPTRVPGVRERGRRHIASSVLSCRFRPLQEPGGAADTSGGRHATRTSRVEPGMRLSQAQKLGCSMLTCRLRTDA